MADSNGNQSWVLPVISLLAGVFGAYLSIQFTIESRISKLESTLAAKELRIAVIDKWVLRTEGNRFTLRDGRNLEQRIEQHIMRSGHGNVIERLAKLEAGMRHHDDPKRE